MNTTRMVATWGGVWSGGTDEIYVRLLKQEPTETGTKRYNAKIEWVEYEFGDELPYPPIVLDFPAAQNLMDSLWNCGLRPTEGKGSAGALAATERHLKHTIQMLEYAMPSALRKCLRDRMRGGNKPDDV